METVRIETYKKAFLSREHGVRAARVLFDYYVERADSHGYLSRRKGEIATDLNVSERTVANYVYTLISMNLIKRKFNGNTVLNPDFFYSGDSAELEKVKKVFTDFKSDYKK